MLQLVQTTSGAVSGTAGRHCEIFRGIPYATARRFCPPVPYPRWDGVRPCLQFAPSCMQIRPEPGLPHQDFYLREYGAPQALMVEDSLCLNIWTPAGTADDRLPVLVFLHGGGFRSGSGGDLPFDGEALAAQGVILVTLNYRVGPFAFFAHPELSGARADGVSGNNDLRDQQAALFWVRENIAAFGGDPDNVTLCGQSTGGAGVAAQLQIPSSLGLYRKAAIQSGLGACAALASSATLADAESWGEQVCRIGKKTPAQLQAMSAPALLQLFRYAEEHGAGEAPVHVNDGVFLPVCPGRGVQTLVRPELPLLLSVVNGDRCADYETALCRRRAAAGARTYLAFFHPEIPGRNLPGYMPDGMAYHNADLWFVFGTLERCWRPFTHAHAALSDAMVRAWAQFAKCGAPEGWTPWSQAGEWVLDLTDSAPYAVSRRAAEDAELQELLNPFF